MGNIEPLLTEPLVVRLLLGPVLSFHCLHRMDKIPGSDNGRCSLLFQDQKKFMVVGQGLMESTELARGGHINDNLNTAGQ